MNKEGIQILALAGMVVIIAAMFWLAAGKARAEREFVPVVAQEVEELPQPVVIKVDNVGCVIAEEPTLTYYVQTDTVRASIECDSDILFHYLPAMPVVNVGE